MTYASALQPSDVYLSIVPFQGGIPESSTSFYRSECQPSRFVPVLEDTQIPSRNVVRAALDKVKSDGGTRTGRGVAGAQVYTAQLKAKYPTHKVVLVLATDGDLTTCGSDFSDAAAVLDTNTSLKSALAAGPTYVIAIGEKIASLNQMAALGGTSPPVFVDGSSSTQLAQKLNAKLSDIRSSFSCDLPIPESSPGSGVIADTTLLNVLVTTQAGGSSALVYSQGCTISNAFMFDNPARPTKAHLVQRCVQRRA